MLKLFWGCSGWENCDEDGESASNLDRSGVIVRDGP